MLMGYVSFREGNSLSLRITGNVQWKGEFEPVFCRGVLVLKMMAGLCQDT